MRRTTPRKRAVGPDGKKLGIFMMHGGASDWRSIERLARAFCGKRGFKVCSMTYPGRFYLPDPSRDWPDDTFHADGTVRTPIWLRGETVAPDEYEVKLDASHRAIYGSRSYAAAKPGTRFHLRMAAWPKAIVEAMRDICRRHFPPEEWSIYVHGHSTGGPFVHTLMQRVDQRAGLIGIENSSFGEFYRAMAGHDWPTPFNYVLVRNWRELARYRGAELAMQEGEKPLLPPRPGDGRGVRGLERGETLSAVQGGELVPQSHAVLPDRGGAGGGAVPKAELRRDRGAGAGVSRLRRAACQGPGVKPVPPILHGINKFSRDHTPENYRVIAEKFARL